MGEVRAGESDLISESGGPQGIMGSHSMCVSPYIWTYTPVLLKNLACLLALKLTGFLFKVVASFLLLGGTQAPHF